MNESGAGSREQGAVPSYTPAGTAPRSLLPLEISQYLIGRRDGREKDAVTQAIERHPQGGEPLGGGAVDGGDAEVLGEPVLRGEPKALSAQLVVVRQVGPALAGAPGGDVVRKQAGEPEAVVAEMHAQQKGSFPSVVEPREVLHR